MTISVESVCTHAELLAECGSSRMLGTLLPPEHSGSSTTFRTSALEDVIKALRRRSPPVYEQDLADVTELRDAVAYGTLARLYRLAMTGAIEGDAMKARAKHYQDLYDAEISTLSPTVGDGAIAAVSSISFSRR